MATDTKLSCYINSVKSDAVHVGKAFIPIMQLVVIAVVTLGITIWVYTVTLSFTESNRQLVYQFYNLFSQSVVYILAMIVFDIIILNEVRAIQTNPEQYNIDSDAFRQVSVSLISLGIVFGVNALLTFLSRAYPDSVTISGWSYMVAESVINAVVLVMAIFLVRAYIKCHPFAKEGKKEGEPAA
jgi:hypothetical protein